MLKESRYARYHRRHQTDPAYRKRRSALSVSWGKKNKERKRANNDRYMRGLRHAAIMKYGGYHCACPGGCSVEIPMFLGLDHINGGGSKHRKEIGTTNFYGWLKRNNYPPGFRVLCHNCNLARGFYGRCPHEVSSLPQEVSSSA